MNISTSNIHARLSAASLDNRTQTNRAGSRELDSVNQRRDTLRGEVDKLAKREAALVEFGEAPKGDGGGLFGWILQSTSSMEAPQKVEGELVFRSNVDDAIEDGELLKNKHRAHIELARAEVNDIYAELESADESLRSTYSALDEILTDAETLTKKQSI